MSFFDEGDEPTRTRARRARPAQPRRPATSGRGSGPPDRQTVRVRQAIALGGLLLLFVLIVFGVKGCVSSHAKNALKDYNRNVTAVVDDSDNNVGKEFFRLLANGARNSDQLSVQVNQLRLAAEADVKRARGLSVPGDMTAAQRNLELVLNFRLEGVEKIGDLVPSALARGATSEQAINRMAGEMQLFLSSDVIYAERVAPLINDALSKNGIHGQTIAGSRFMPDIAWINPATIGERLGKGTGTASNQAVAPGLHGHGLLSTTLGDKVLQPKAPGVVNTVVSTPNAAVTVKFQNQGDNTEQNVKVTVRLSGEGIKTVALNKTVPSTTAKQPYSVSIPLGVTPRGGTPATLEVSIAKVPGEQNTDNNHSSYTIVFTS